VEERAEREDNTRIDGEEDIHAAAATYHERTYRKVEVDG
jgi:hypothetical protein